jgi:hypothetical protein
MLNVVFVVSLAGAFGAGWYARAGRTPAPAEPTSRAVEAAGREDRGAARELRAEVDKLRAELLAEIRGKATPGGAPKGESPDRPPEPPSPPTPAQQEARTNVDALLERAARSHTWTESDRDDFRQLLARLDFDGRTAALSRLAKAINRQEIRLTYQGLP